MKIRSYRRARMAQQADAPTTNHGRGGFTLTELLIVIAIIGVLATLTVAGVMAAMRKARAARIQLELNEISQTFDSINSEHGVYPPNLMHPGANTDIARQVHADLKKTLSKMFPRHQEPPGLLQALAGLAPTDSSNATPLEGGLNPAEAVYFWLGGFSNDPRYPISGEGGPSFNINDASGEIVEDRNRLIELDLTRIGPRDADNRFDVLDISADGDSAGRFITYTVNRGNGGEDRRINLWQYMPSGSEKPYVYFDTSRYKPYEYDMHYVDPDSSGDEVHAIEKLREGISTPSEQQDLVFVNDRKCQVLHCGLDEDWGVFAPLSLFESGNNVASVITYPEGPFVGAIADTLTNFTTDTLESAQE